MARIENLEKAYPDLMAATRDPVPWAYDIWDELVATLASKNNRHRSIAAQVLSALAKSDPENRMARTFPKLLEATKDERFVTARHTLQSLWEVAIVTPAHEQMVARGLAQRFAECSSEKNCTLIRYDITELFRKIYDLTKAESIREQSQQLIATETDDKYRRKYAAVWRRK